MVLGIRSKSRKTVSVQVHYTIHVQEINPWPPSQSLRSVQTVLLQWENGDQISGSLASTAGIGKIQFNESFRLSVLMWREASKKSKHRESFQKNYLEFSLYDKTTKSQLLGSATVNFADFGIIKETKALSIVLNCKKSSKNSSQPFLYISIQPFDTECSSSSPSSSLSKGLSLDKEGSESVSQSLKDDDDVEIVSFTDDDNDEFHSNTFQTIRSDSKTTGGSIKISGGGTEGTHGEFVQPAESTTSSLVGNSESQAPTHNGIKSPPSSTILGSDMGNAADGSPSLPKISEETVELSNAISEIQESIQQSSSSRISSSMQPNFERPFEFQVTQESSVIQEDDTRDERLNKDALEKVSCASDTGVMEDKEKMEEQRIEQKQFLERNELLENELNRFSNDDSTKKGNLNNTTLLNEKPHGRGQKQLNEKNEPLENELNNVSNDDPTMKRHLYSTALRNEKLHGKGQKQFTERNEPLEDGLNKFSNDDSMKKGNLNSTTLPNEKLHGKKERQFTERNEALENELNNFSIDDSTKKGNLNSTSLLNEKPHGKGQTQFTKRNEPLENELNKFSNDDSMKKGSLNSTSLLNEKPHGEGQTQFTFTDRNEPLENELNNFSNDDFTKKGYLNSTILPNEKLHGKGQTQFTEKNEPLENELSHFSIDDSMKKGNLNSTSVLNEKPHGKGQTQFTEKNEPLENELNKFSNDDSTKKGNLNSTTLPNEKLHGKKERQFTERNEPLENELNNFSNDDSTKKGNLNSTTLPNEKLHGEKERLFIERNELLENELNRFSNDDSTKKGNLNSTILPNEKLHGEKERLFIERNELLENELNRFSNDDSTKKGNLNSTSLLNEKQHGKGQTQFTERDEPLENEFNNFSNDDSMKKENLNSTSLLNEKPRGKGQTQFTERNEPLENELNNFSNDDSMKKENLNSTSLLNEKPHGKGQTLFTERNEPLENELNNFSNDDSMKKENLKSTSRLNEKPHGKGQTQFTERNEPLENELNNFPNDSRKKGDLNSTALLNEKPQHPRLMNDKIPLQSAENCEQISNQTHNQAEEISTMNDVYVGTACHEDINTSGSFLSNKTELKAEVEMLREELREAAALEVSMYSVIAEHGSSSNKVHAPARRLSRFYFHACRVGSPATIASAAQSAVSGFVLVSKACGNDVPRLTFWFSNLLLLRAIVSKEVENIPFGDGSCINSECDAVGNTLHEEEKDKEKQFHSWEDPKTFLIALEKVEAWIFSRIVESVWWQTLTPYMQSAAAKSSNSKKVDERRPRVGDPDQGSFSVDLWKRAFKDACERLCPVRTGGHECGCLAVIARLVMEQLVSRLDLAMFNAILRESAEEMPMDPVSDPISDSKVLPIPAGKSGFAAGAQLKNAIGDWSRWLSDLFSIDDSESCEVSNENDEPKCESSFKPFLLLNSLSDLMMLPLDMLADESMRKEVCPRFGISLIKRVLNNFVPDEFSPGPIPDAVFDALNNEDIEDDEGAITSLPCSAGATFYAPLPASSIVVMLQEVGTKTSLRSGSFALKKLYTSDDELDELDSPLSALGMDESKEKSALVKGGRKVVRYELLRESWKSSE